MVMSVHVPQQREVSFFSLTYKVGSSLMVEVIIKTKFSIKL